MPQHLFLIGSMKCGTTALYDYLLHHPAIQGGKVKEPEYFAKKLGQQKFKGGDYLDLFRPIDPVAEYLMDGSTGYTKYPHEQGVPRRIAAYCQQPKIIYVVRDPIERIESHYNFMLRNPAWKREITDPYLIAVSNYQQQIVQYEAIFARKNILVINFTDLKKQPQQVCNTVFAFLGLPPFQVAPELFVVKNKTKITSRKRTKLKSTFRPLLNVLPDTMKRRLKSLIEGVVPAKKTALTEIQAQTIREELREDIDAFAARYGLDISSWRKFNGG